MGNTGYKPAPTLQTEVGDLLMSFLGKETFPDY